jgi:MFS family permease
VSVRAVLAHRSFACLLVGRTVSLAGSGLAGIAIAFAVLDLTGSATDLGLVLAARSVPLVVFVLFGGVIADRLPRHLVLVVTNLVSGVTQAAAAGLLLTDHASIASLMALEAVNGASSAFIFPASAGLLPQTVPPADLQAANVVLRMATTAALVAGTSAGGVVVATVGPGSALVVDAATFFVGALCFALVRLPSGETVPAGSVPASSVPTSNVLRELREGWTAFRSRTWLWVVVLAFTVINAVEAAGWSTLGPAIADDTFGRAGWGFVLGAQTLGMFVCGALLLRLRFRRPLLAGMIGMLVYVPVMFVLAAEPAVLLLVVASLVGGAALEVFGLGWDLSMQQHVPPHMLSRVYAYDGLGSVVAIPIGQVVAGPLAAGLGLHDAVVALATLAMVAAAVPLCVPAVRRLERTDLDQPAPDVVSERAG